MEGGRRELPQEGGVFVRPGDQEADAREVQAAQERELGRFGDQEGTVGVEDVAGQVGASVGGVDAGDGGSREGGGREPVDELRCVVEEYAYVRGCVRWEEGGEQGRSGGGFAGEVVVGEDGVPPPQGRAVVGPAPGDEFGGRGGVLRGLHGGAR
ncbi:hypothetical protein IQ63_05170 [Streptomyces acidiscabies]|uniref:Uncharacterized protein n=1 Tax=Streptomyces acidiscabies TaxID=42234 RepID=A0A0L0KNG1_9ACTN|nr:hypothetical protein IQ63_05170 [Streptomyces acidiscabies]